MMKALLFLLAAVSFVQASFWMEDIAHQGKASFNPDPNYQVFRNVKDFGAKGDGGRLSTHTHTPLLCLF